MAQDERTQQEWEREVETFFECSGLPRPEIFADWETGDRMQIRARVEEDARRDQAQARRAEDELMETTTVTPVEAAELVNMTEDDLRDRVYVAVHHGQSRVPLWQIRDGRPLPGLDTILPALRDSTLSASTLHLVMTIGQDSLAGASYADYLAAGGDPARVVDVLTTMEWT